MASLIAHDAVPTYVSPAVVMYLRDDGPLVRVCGDISSDEEEGERDKKKEMNEDSRSSDGVNSMSRRGGGVGGSRNWIDKRGEDSAYSSIGGTMMDNDDCASTTSSIPVDPSTQVPVFLVPSDMEFVVAGDSPDTRKVLTLYNPYDYAFQFRILCTAPEYYNLQKPSGIVGAKRVVEIPIRGLPTLMPSMMHRIKVEIRRLGQNELLGSRIVTMRSVAFASAAPMEGGGQGVFHRMGGNGVRGDRGTVGPDLRIEAAAPAAAPVNLSLMLVVSALCLLALCLPIQKETSEAVSIIPQYLHISETQRVVAAFILGVCSVLILQPANR